MYEGVARMWNSGFFASKGGTASAPPLALQIDKSWTQPVADMCLDKIQFITAVCSYWKSMAKKGVRENRRIQDDESHDKLPGGSTMLPVIWHVMLRTFGTSPIAAAKTWLFHIRATASYRQYESSQNFFWKVAPIHCSPYRLPWMISNRISSVE
jgi:hypothetical protein